MTLTPQRKETVLLVDDSPIIRKTVKDFLLLADYEVVIARDARECLQKLATSPALDLGLLDIEMPHIDGIQLVKMIRRQPAYSDMPIIMISASSDKMRVLQSIQAGAKDYIVKPFDEQTLFEKMDKYLNAEKTDAKVAG